MLGPVIQLAARSKNSVSGQLTRAITSELRRVGSKERAVKQQAYMKSEMPFAGVTAPELRAMQKILFLKYPLPTKALWQQEVLSMFCCAPVRELRFIAIELAFYKPYRKWLTTEVWPMLDTLVVTGAWWDAIDALAPNHYAHLLEHEPRVTKPLLRKYAKDKNIWRRRVAILCQLKAKAKTDEALLFGNIDKSLGQTDFFIRKAIGWALRAHSRTNPEAVIQYIEANAQQLSPLSKREGLKVLVKQGAKLPASLRNS